LVRLGLAVLLWFILVVTFLDQLRRQLAALGFGSRGEQSRGAPTDLRLVGYLVALLLGGTIAAWTFEPAVQAGISLIWIVGTLDPTRFALLEFVLMIVFSYADGRRSGRSSVESFDIWRTNFHTSSWNGA
jgi:hypothetical protein